MTEVELTAIEHEASLASQPHVTSLVAEYRVALAQIDEFEHAIMEVVSLCHCWVMAEKTTDCRHTYEQIDEVCFRVMGVKNLDEFREHFAEGKDEYARKLDKKTVTSLLEQNLRLLEDNVALINALESLRYGDPKCFCEVAIGNPLFVGRHSKRCLAALSTLEKVRR